MSSYPFRLPDGSIARKAADGSGTEQAPYRNRDLAELPAEQLAVLASQATLAQVLAALAGTLDVSGPLTDAQLRAAALPLPQGAATEATLELARALLATRASEATLASVLAELQATLDVALTPDARNAALASVEITLSGTPGTVTTVTIPDTAQGFRLYPRANPCRFAIGESPAAVGASSATTIAAAAFGVGGIAKANQWETRLLAAGTSRTVGLRSTTASLVIDMEVF